MPLSLPYGLSFADLHSRSGLARLDAEFCALLAAEDARLAARLAEARAQGVPTPTEESALILALAPHVERMLGAVFGVADALEALRAQAEDARVIERCRARFVRRRAARALSVEAACALDGAALERDLLTRAGDDATALTALGFARAVERWEGAADGDALRVAECYAAWAIRARAGQARWRDEALFVLPKAVDPLRRVPQHPTPRLREGFALVDTGISRARALGEAGYCLICHPRGKDSCAHGLRDKAGGVVADALGEALEGCPLEQKISEMHLLWRDGMTLAALATIMIDNPLCALTGRRICNDCIRSCIFQKQDAVQTPEVETRILEDSLRLPWGAEIYLLLTRWNPLNVAQPLPLPASGRSVLVAGLGPAGIALSLGALNRGHRVFAIDGVKIAPREAPFAPIRDFADWREDLQKREPGGFGGVMEYGVTARWDKNLLGLVRLALVRRAEFTMRGAARLGGDVSAQTAWRLGFDHIAACAGAGEPTLPPPLPDGANPLPHGARMASDFLMTLQLTGAARDGSTANLFLAPPVAVIGGGLTAVDAATEAMAWLPRLAERFLDRWEAVCAAGQGEALRQAWTARERMDAEETLARGREVRDERAQAAKEGRAPDFVRIVRSWGGVSVLYRRELVQSPAYRLNAEEITDATAQGVAFIDHARAPLPETDADGRLSAIGYTDAQGHAHRLPARSLLYAIGARPNRALAKDLDAGTPERRADGLLAWRAQADGRFVSAWGDLDPQSAGNVAKAMGGVKRRLTAWDATLRAHTPACADADAPSARLAAALETHTLISERHANGTIVARVHAPARARAFRPGAIYRFQNLASDPMEASEPLAMTGSDLDADAGWLEFTALATGGGVDSMARLAKGEPVALMGPTGLATDLTGRNIVLVGGGVSVAVLGPLAQEAKARGARVWVLAAFRRCDDIVGRALLERHADAIAWVAQDALPEVRRAQDTATRGSVLDGLTAWAAGRLAAPFAPEATNRVFVIGSVGMMEAVAGACAGSAFAGRWRADCARIASINAPMQCMMKGLCAQCLQRRGDGSLVFACAGQDMPLDDVDFAFLRERLALNGVEEKLTAAWKRSYLTEEQPL